MPVLAAPHVWLDERAVAWVDDTNTKVREIALDVLAHGWTPGEVQLHHQHLSLAKIHAALAWYYDHKSTVDAEIEAGLKRAEALRAALRKLGCAWGFAWMLIFDAGHRWTRSAGCWTQRFLAIMWNSMKGTG